MTAFTDKLACRRGDRNEDGFALVETLIYIALFPMIMTICALSAASATNGMNVALLKNDLNNAHNLVIDFAARKSVGNNPLNPIAPTPITVITDACDGEVVTTQGLNIPAGDTTCITVTGDTSNYSISGYSTADPDHDVLTVPFLSK